VESWKRQPRLFSLLISPAIIWLTLFFIIPLGFMVGLSLSVQPDATHTVFTGTLESYYGILDRNPDTGDYIYIGVILKSLMIAAIVTFFCLALGYPVALAIAFAPAKWRPILLLLVILPFWTNLLIRTYALMSVFRVNGFFNNILAWVWNHSRFMLLGTYQPFDLLYTNTAVIVGLVYIHLPFMVLPLYTAVEKLDRSYLEASLDLGAGHWRTFFKVMVPLTLPAIMAGGIITFIPAFGALVTPDLLGGVNSQMIGNIIERQFKAANNWPFGAALSLILVYITFILLALQSWMASRRAKLDDIRR